MSSINEILTTIKSSADSTKKLIDLLNEKYDSPELPELVKDLLTKTQMSMPEGVSLLDLKNHSMLAYLNNLSLIILARLEALKTNNVKKIEELKQRAIKGTIVQRVVLENGIKNLEKKTQYQLDKMVRNYTMMERDSSQQEVEKKLIKQKEQKGSNETQDSEEDSEEEDSEDELNYRPDASALVESMKKKAQTSKDKPDEKQEKYRPPKISAALPPSEFREVSNRHKKNASKLQSMEEYLMETGDAPMAEASIGSNILDNGRGGVKTVRDRAKEEEVKRFEEANFTRLSMAQQKKDKQNAKRRQADTFFGEDWGIFNNKKDDMNTSRKSKPKSAWDRAKKRRTQ